MILRALGCKKAGLKNSTLPPEYNAIKTLKTIAEL